MVGIIGVEDGVDDSGEDNEGEEVLQPYYNAECDEYVEVSITIS